jgi:H/ACA ribonucleoprotein complex subunit 3
VTEPLMHVCPACHRYTLAARCPACGGATRSPHPVRFSPEDRWGRYRRALFAEARADAGSA